MGKKNDMVTSNFYAPHLNGGRRLNNPANNMQGFVEQMHFNNLIELCANRFEWQGLPDSVDTRFLELQLAHTGLCIIYQDHDMPDGKLLAVRGSGAGHTNFNDNPVHFNVIGPGAGAGRSKILSAIPTRSADGEERVPAQCVPVWANYTRRPELDVIMVYSYKLAKLDRTIEITMDNMRKTKIIRAPENQRQTYVNILRQVAEGQEVVLGTDNLVDPTAIIEVLDMGMDPLTLPNLMIAKSKLWNECMGLLGVNNANQDKKERLVAAEVGANDDQVQATRNVALNARQIAAAQISELYGIEVTVDFKNPPITGTDAPGAEFVTGGSTTADNQGAGAN